MIIPTKKRYFKGVRLSQMKKEITEIVSMAFFKGLMQFKFTFDTLIHKFPISRSGKIETLPKK
jgi:hypothetical protein